MRCTKTARRDHARRGWRCSSDLTDRTCGLIGPLSPGPRRVRRPRTMDLRDVVECGPIPRRDCLPAEPAAAGFSTFATVRRYFYDWRNGGLSRAIDHRLVIAARDLEGWEASPSAGVIDSRCVQTTWRGGPSRSDVGKPVNRREPCVAVALVGVMVGADVGRRDGAPIMLRSTRTSRPWLCQFFADGGHAGPKLRAALKGKGAWWIEIINGSDVTRGFEALPRRRVAGRSGPRLGRSCRLAQDRDSSVSIAEAWLPTAHIRLPIRFLARFHAGWWNYETRSELDFVHYAAKHSASAMRTMQSGGISCGFQFGAEYWKISPTQMARRTQAMSSVKVRLVLRYQAAA